MNPDKRDGAESAQFTLLMAFFIYCWTILPAALCYNWAFIQQNGVEKWLFFGEVVAAARATVWPYYAIKAAYPDRTEPPTHRIGITATPKISPELAKALRQIPVSPPKATESEPKSICTPFFGYVSDGTATVPLPTPDRWNHLNDENFTAMGYRLVPCSKATIVLQTEMTSLRPAQSDARVIVRIEGRGNGRSDMFQAEFSASEDMQKIEGRIGFGTVKVMETLEPGFMEQYHRTFDDK